MNIRYYLYLSIIISYPLNSCLSQSSSDNQSIEDSITLDKFVGVWSHAEDSLATIEIHKKYWIFYYDNAMVAPPYSSTLKTNQKIPLLEDSSQVNYFFEVKNSIDTAYYEIMSITDSNMTLLFYPIGKPHIYYRKE